MTKTILITGASSGIGRSTSKLLSARGFNVVGADVEAAVGVDVVDVRDGAAVRDWIEEATRTYGGIDGVVTFAGHGLVGAVEETSPEEAADLLDVNLLGTARVVRAAMPRLRERGNGRVIVVSSGAAQVAQPFGGWYSASKAAVEKLGEALRMEAAPLGVNVSILTPGWTRTSILDKSRTVGSRIGAYAEASAAVASRNADHLGAGQSPEAVAWQVLRILTARRPRQNYRVGRDVRLSAIARRLSPPSVYEHLVRDYYGMGKAAPRLSTALPPMVDPDGIRTLDTRLRLYGDAQVGEYQGRELPNERVRLAYRIYSKAYPVVATLVFWIVWNGNLRVLGKFYGAQIRAASVRGTTFVDVGVGDGSLTKYALKTAKVKTLPDVLLVDLSPEMLRKAAKRFRKSTRVVSLVADVATLGIADGAARAIGCYGALHVFTEPQSALERLTRMLAADGELSLSILTSPGVPWKDRLIERFVATNTITNNFTIPEVRAMVTKAGLVPIEEIRNGHQLLMRVRRADGEGCA